MITAQVKALLRVLRVLALELQHLPARLVELLLQLGHLLGQLLVLRRQLVLAVLRRLELRQGVVVLLLELLGVPPVLRQCKSRHTGRQRHGRHRPRERAHREFLSKRIDPAPHLRNLNPEFRSPKSATNSNDASTLPAGQRPASTDPPFRAFFFGFWFCFEFRVSGFGFSPATPSPHSVISPGGLAPPLCP